MMIRKRLNLFPPNIERTTQRIFNDPMRPKSSLAHQNISKLWKLISFIFVCIFLLCAVLVFFKKNEGQFDEFMKKFCQEMWYM